MCWTTSLKIVLDKDTEAARKATPLPESKGIALEGRFPSFSITHKGMCGCSMVGKNGTSLNGAEKVAEKLVRMPRVKRVEMFWYWSKKPGGLEEETVDVEDFLSRNASKALEKNKIYRINDAAKFLSRRKK